MPDYDAIAMAVFPVIEILCPQPWKIEPGAVAFDCSLIDADGKLIAELTPSEAEALREGFGRYAERLEVMTKVSSAQLRGLLRVIVREAVADDNRKGVELWPLGWWQDEEGNVWAPRQGEEKRLLIAEKLPEDCFETFINLMKTVVVHFLPTEQR